MLVIGLTQKVGIASTWPGIICQQFGTILPCLCNGPYPPSDSLIRNCNNYKAKGCFSPDIVAMQGHWCSDTFSFTSFKNIKFILSLFISCTFTDSDSA